MIFLGFIGLCAIKTMSTGYVKKFFIKGYHNQDDYSVEYKVAENSKYGIYDINVVCELLPERYFVIVDSKEKSPIFIAHESYLYVFGDGHFTIKVENRERIIEYIKVPMKFDEQTPSHILTNLTSEITGYFGEGMPGFVEFDPKATVLFRLLNDFWIKHPHDRLGREDFEVDEIHQFAKDYFSPEPVTESYDNIRVTFDAKGCKIISVGHIDWSYDNETHVYSYTKKKVVNKIELTFCQSIKFDRIASKFFEARSNPDALKLNRRYVVGKIDDFLDDVRYG